MTQKPSSLEQWLAHFNYGADTSRCTIENLPDLIRTRAHELFEVRGRQPGRELEDWLQAEREMNKLLGFWKQ